MPDPKSQVEQITITLIYKFMDDMDAEAEELGGARKFFNGEFAKYGRTKLMSPAMGGHEVSKTMTKLYLDDYRTLPEGWILVKNYDEFVEFIEKNGLPDIVSFDHDLAKEHYPWSPETKPSFSQGFIDYTVYQEKTGYDCAKWLIEYCRKNELALPVWKVHSMNHIGAENIEKLLSSAS